MFQPPGQITDNRAGELMDKFGYPMLLGDQDWFTNLQWEQPMLVHPLPCRFNAQVLKQHFLIITISHSYLSRLTWNTWRSLGWTPSLTTITATTSDLNQQCGRRHFHLSCFSRSRLAVVHRNGCGPLPEFCGNPKMPNQVQLLSLPPPTCRA